MARSWWPGGAALLGLCALTLVPGQGGIPAVDRDESRFAQASRQMFEAAALPPERLRDGLHGGGWAVPMVGDRPRLNKPPLTYWLQGGSAAALTGGDPSADAVWMYRLPSAIAAALAVLISWRLGVAMLDPRAAWTGAACLAVSPMIVWDAHQARADQVLLAATTAAMACLGLIARATWRSRRPGVLVGLGLWLMIALGVLAKGPITPLVVGSAWAALLALHPRRGLWLAAVRPVSGPLILLACVAPWAIAVIGSIGASEALQILRREVLDRSARAAEGHWGPPGYHLLLSVALLWPASMGATAGLVRAVSLTRRHMRERARAPGRWQEPFLLAWLVPSWVVFEFVGTKLPHYTLPLYPAAALLSVRAILSSAMWSGPPGAGQAMGVWVWGLTGLGVCVAVPATLMVLGGWAPAGLGGLGAIAALGCGALCVIKAWAGLRRRGTGSAGGARAVVLGVAGASVSLAALHGIVLPGLSGPWVSAQLEASLRAEGWSPDAQAPPIGAVGFAEDSLVFATRGGLARLSPEEAPQWIAARPGGWLVAPRVLAESWPEGLRARLRARGVSGFNYSTGRTVDLVLLGPASGAAVPNDP